MAASIKPSADPLPLPFPSPLTRRSLDQFISDAVGVILLLDLDALVRCPPPINTISSAYVWARCLPLAMEVIGRRPGYSIEVEREIDRFWTLRDLGEEYLANCSPATGTEAALLIDLLNANSDDGPSDFSNGMLDALERFLFRASSVQLASSGGRRSFASKSARG